MGGKNANRVAKISTGIRTSSKMLAPNMVGAYETFAFPEYGSFVRKTIIADEAIKNNTVDQLPQDIQDHIEDYRTLAQLLNGTTTKHLHFLLWATTMGQTLVETTRSKEPILDKNGNTIPKYPELLGNNILKYPGVETIPDAFEKIQQLAPTLSVLKNKYPAHHKGS